MFEVKWLIGDELASIGPFPAHVTLQTLHELTIAMERMYAESSSPHIHDIVDLSAVVQFPKSLAALRNVMPYAGNPRLKSSTIIGRTQNPLIIIFSKLLVRRTNLYFMPDLDSALKNLALTEKISATTR